MQNLEGARLKSDLRDRLESLRASVEHIEAQHRGSKNGIALGCKSGSRTPAATHHLDDDRILREIAVFAERCDISEELTRLQSHFDQYLRYFNQDEPVGRSLDFLCQRSTGS